MLKQRFLRSYWNNCEVEIIKDVSDKRDSKKNIFSGRRYKFCMVKIFINIKMIYFNSYISFRELQFE